MNRRLITLAAVLMLSGAGTAPQAAAAPESVSVASDCTSQYRVTGKKVAVRKPASGPVAAPNSPVVRYLHRGDVVTSCVAAIARTQSGPAYRKCGKGGHVWRIVRGGQVPATCLAKL
ncbi:hypothetical protein [Streptomyces sp. NPDC048224]|uniref:hypothetical protein n=1 Tax=Streptomyces sp. NPDC048224 TaxID=3154500 RepID=UPI003411CE9C